MVSTIKSASESGLTLVGDDEEARDKDCASFVRAVERPRVSAPTLCDSGDNPRELL